MARYELKVGDEIDVYGFIFILSEVRAKADQPAEVFFEQPIERMKK